MLSAIPPNLVNPSMVVAAILFPAAVLVAYLRLRERRRLKAYERYLNSLTPAERDLLRRHEQDGGLWTEFRDIEEQAKRRFS